MKTVSVRPSCYPVQLMICQGIYYLYITYTENKPREKREPWRSDLVPGLVIHFEFPSRHVFASMKGRRRTASALKEVDHSLIIFPFSFSKPRSPSLGFATSTICQKRNVRTCTRRFSCFVRWSLLKHTCIIHSRPLPPKRCPAASSLCVCSCVRTHGKFNPCTLYQSHQSFLILFSHCALTALPIWRPPHYRKLNAQITQARDTWFLLLFLVFAFGFASLEGKVSSGEEEEGSRSRLNLDVLPVLFRFLATGVEDG